MQVKLGHEKQQSGHGQRETSWLQKIRREHHFCVWFIGFKQTTKKLLEMRKEYYKIEFQVTFMYVEIVARTNFQVKQMWVWMLLSSLSGYM